MFESLISLAAGWVLPGLFFWAVLSIAAMAVQDWTSELFKKRSFFLEKGIMQMLDNQSLVDKFFAHPLLLSHDLNKQGKNKKQHRPAYIPPRIFAQILLDQVIQTNSEDKEKLSIAKLREKLISFASSYSKIGSVITILFVSAGIDDHNSKLGELLQKTQEGLQNWFEDCMKDLTHRYKIYSRKSLFVIGLLLAIYTNFDIITLTVDLWSSEKISPLTQSLMENYVPREDTNLSVEEQLIDSIELYNIIEKENRLPIGWYRDEANDEVSCIIMTRMAFTVRNVDGSCISISGLPSQSDLFGWMIKLIGLLTGGAAIAVGAQFTYDAFGRGSKTSSG